MRAIVVRHYKTLLNASDQILGWGDAPRAKDWQTDLGVVDDTLRARGIRLDAICSSVLERSRQTAMYFARRHGIPIVYDSPALNEVNYGLLYRKSKKWVAGNIPQHKKDPDFVYPEGESFRQMQARSVRFLVSLTGLFPQETVLVVVHAGVIRGFVCHFLGLDYAEHLQEKISHRYIGEFRFEGERCVSYDEWGKPSGFVRSGAVGIPFRNIASATAACLTRAAPQVGTARVSSGETS